MMSTKKETGNRYVFFGTGEIGAAVLEELAAASLRPSLVVTAPDRDAGRGLRPKPSPVGAFAARLGIDVAKPRTFDEPFVADLAARHPPLLIVADYGAILPKKILAIPEKGVLNMHPSLLPRLRGSSPIRSAILNDEQTVGVTIMLLDEKVDHGPILAQKKIALPLWPPRGKDLDEALSREGGKLLAEVLPPYLEGKIVPLPQNHDLATYSRQFTKEDGLLELPADGYQNLLKIRAFEGWPGTYAFFRRGEKRIRVQILDAHLEGAKLVIDTVRPEGKSAMPYADFLRSGTTPA